jgi:hypothetical protein
MNSDSHERARTMIALSGAHEVPSAEPAWLTAHLESCPSCSEFAENTRAAIHALRSVSISASGRLVSTTQMRVRQRALELQHQQERLWTVIVCCAAVAICSALTSVALWRGVAWIAQAKFRLPAPLWECTFIVLSLLPAVLAGVLLLANGTFMADHGGSASRGAA